MSGRRPSKAQGLTYASYSAVNLAFAWIGFASDPWPLTVLSAVSATVGLFLAVAAAPAFLPQERRRRC